MTSCGLNHLSAKTFSRYFCWYIIISGGVEETRGGVLEDSFWSPWPWPRRSSPRKLACPRLEDRTTFWIVKILWSAWKILWKTFFCGDCLKNFSEALFFIGEHLRLCPWSLASRVSVLGKAVLGLRFFLCPWPWVLCPRLHLWRKPGSRPRIQKNPRPRTGMFEAKAKTKDTSASVLQKKKTKVFKKFSGDLQKKSSKKFFRSFPKNQKKVFKKIFSGVLQ